MKKNQNQCNQANLWFLHQLRVLVGWGFRLSKRLHQHTDTTPFAVVPMPNSAKPLVVMIHGYQGNPGEFHHLTAALHQALGAYFDFTVVDTLDSGNDPSPDENCLRITAFLAEKQLDSRELYLIAHSMGGLSARRFPHLFPEMVVKAMALIATPNGGVHSWNLLPIHWLRSATFDERINRHCPALPATRYLLVCGTKGSNFLEGKPNDRVVGLWSVMRFQECNEAQADVETRIYPHDHWELLRSDRVADDIAAFLLNAYRNKHGV